MTGAEFRALRLAQGLSLGWVAASLDVQERTVRYWERRDEAVPQDAAEFLAGCARLQDLMVSEAVKAFDATASRPDRVALLAYRDDSDLHYAFPMLDFWQLPCSWHLVALERTAARFRSILAHENAVRIVYYEADDFAAWMARNRVAISTTQARAAYAVELASKLDD